MNTQLHIFISSKMLELKEEREALYALLPTLNYGDIQLHAWVFEEDAPASGKPIREIYLNALQNSALYIGLFWNLYGEWTIDEFERARDWGIERHIYVKDVEENKRDPNLTAFLDKHGEVSTGITAKWFKTTDELRESVKDSIETWVRDRLVSRPGGTSAVLARDPDDITEKPRKLIGRDELLHEVDRLLDDGERVLLQGFGGMGKTALAATIAAKRIADGKGPMLWLKLGSTSADALFEALARGINKDHVQAIARESGDTKIQIIRSLLRQSSVKLLVLDDAWNGHALFQVIKAVPSDMPVLVTARQRFSVDKIRDVGELATDDALHLLGYYADFDYNARDDAALLCKTLGYHAFAIEIAGKTLKARKWTPTELLEQIKDAPHDLKTPGDFSEKEHASVKDLLDASLNALDEEVRAAFLAFGAFFAPNATAEVLSIYIGRPIEKALDTMQIHGLVERIPANEEAIVHYRVHDLAYSYAKAQVTNEQRHKALDVCLIYIESHSHPDPANFSVLRPQLDNFLEAANWAMAQGRYSEVEQFAQAMYADGGILNYQGNYTEAITLLHMAKDAAVKRGGSPTQLIHLNNLGHAYNAIGQYRQAIEYLEQGLIMVREVGYQRIEASYLNNLGDAHFHLGEYEVALEYYQLSLEIVRRSGDQQGEGIRLGSIGNVHLHLEQFEEAVKYYKQALEIASQYGDQRNEANWLGNLGNVDLKQGKLESAIDYYQESLRIARIIKDRPRIGIAISNLGLAYASQQQLELAIDCYKEGIVIVGEVGDKAGEANLYNNVGALYELLGDYRAAIEHYQHARELFEAIGAMHFVERVAGNIAEADTKLSEMAKDAEE